MRCSSSPAVERPQHRRLSRSLQPPPASSSCPHVAKVMLSRPREQQSDEFQRTAEARSESLLRMKGIRALVVGLTLVVASCESGGLGRLREELDATRSELAAAESAAERSGRELAACRRAVRAADQVAKAAGAALYVAPDVAPLVRSALKSRDAAEVANVREHLRALVPSLRRARSFSERGDPPAWKRFDRASAPCLGKPAVPPIRQHDDVVVSIPLVGRLTWQCDHDREFTFNFIADEATVVVEQSIDGKVTRRRLYPGELLTTGYLPADVHREWKVTYRHAPRISSAGLYVEPEVGDGVCFIRHSILEQNQLPN